LKIKKYNYIVSVYLELNKRMDILIIKPTKTTPYVCFDPFSGNYEISGKSFSGDPNKIFDSIFEWLNNNISCLSHKVELNIKLNYFNSSSIRLILKMLKLLEEQYKSGKEIEIIWYVNDDDDDNEGVMFSQILDIPIRIVFKES
jgi:hypothetical protein